MDQTRFLTGDILLAMPGIGDRRFDHAAIAMCSHDEGGAMGVGIGETIDGLTLHSLLEQLDIAPGVAPDVAVHLGGPVEPRRGFVLHDADWGGQDTIDVAGRWALSGSIDVLRAIAEGSGPRRFLIALGYAGWGEGQLEAELSRHGWLNVAGDGGLLFDVPTPERWRRGFARAGIDPKLLSPGAGTA
ncbi:YqgE/AlgH family protein [Sphingomonas sp. VNH70]|uniref:YqgE/AlgH family protein n=1 Tax=Sphingomonas silueang TaxID=3156617 RepID=UPI0032B3389E